jgi:hypothetical protein
MSKRIRKVTPSFLKRMIVQEARKLRMEVLETGKSDPEKVSAEEVDADDLAGSIESDIDFIKALKIKEARLVRKLKEVKKVKSQVRSRLVKRL